MKKQINPNIKAYLIRGAFYVLLLIAVCAIPFALAQRSVMSGPAGICANYITSTSTDTIVPGVTDTGNHCDDCRTLIPFPFPVSLYGTSFASARVGANGNLQFTLDSDYFMSACPLPNASLDEAILPYQGDLRTDAGADCSVFPGGACGIFTSETGTAPNRQFHIEWRAVYVNGSGALNFEVRFSENNPSCFDVIYGSTPDQGAFQVSGVQQSAGGPATTFSCNAGVLTDGLKVTYCCSQTSPSPTPTPTGTPGCVYGQGYWKNHPAQWRVTQMQLGNVNYNQQQLLLILNQPTRGNGLVSLAGQEILAKLNIANGAAGSCIQQTLTNADALIGNLVVPPVGTGSLAPSVVAALVGTLNDYNVGRLCAPSCGGPLTPARTLR